jgi:hypothetical protein
MELATGAAAAPTGRSLEQWLALVRSSGADPLDQTAVRNWLRREHGAPRSGGPGLRFTDPAQTARLQPGGGPGQATHRVSFRNMGEVDAEIVCLLRVAYEQNV